ncbi:MAG: hypothetical protein KGM42_05735 [Hyphomicrobiales bacterium]|nr:hypothetical protein [Hyphomicrobiales bacterium]
MAAAPVTIDPGAGGRSKVALDAARALIETEPVLRRAALAPDAAAAIARNSRPSFADRLAALATNRPQMKDTLSRASAYLGPRLGLRAGALPDTIEIVAHMPDAGDAAAVATAAAQAFVAEINDQFRASDRRDAGERAERAERAMQRLEAARARMRDLGGIDPAPVASIAPPAQPRDAESATLAHARQNAAAANARVAEAARVYGPRHPELARLQDAARRAKDRLQSVLRMAEKAPARAKSTPLSAEGGPDPRAAERAAAEAEAARAQDDYDLEMSRSETDKRQARLVRPARIPAVPDGAGGDAIVLIASLGGFLFAGAAPALAAHRPRRRVVSDRILGRLRDARLENARATLARLRLRDGRGPQAIVVAAREARLAESGAAAIAFAAIEAGWRPLLVADRPLAADEPARAAHIGDRPLRLRRARMRRGRIDIAEPVAGRRSVSGANVLRAYDLVLMVHADETAPMAPLDRVRVARVANSLCENAAGDLVARLGVEPDRFLGTLLIEA